MPSAQTRIAGLVAGLVCLGVSVANAQTSLSLVDQIRELDAIKTALTPAPQTLKAEQAKALKFVTDPWGTPAPTVDEIQRAFAAIGLPIGAAQGANEGSIFPQAAFINGLTNFIINRAKDEVVISFLLDLRDDVKKDALLKLLFKDTVIASANLEAQSAKQLLGPLKASLTADLRNIPKTLLENEQAIDALQAALARHLSATERQHLNDAVRTFKDDRAALEVGAHALRDLMTGVPALATLQTFSELTPATFHEPKGVRYALITVGTIAREYRWAPAATRDTLKDPLKLPQFFALLARDLRASQTGDGEDAALKLWSARIQLVQMHANDILASLDGATQSLDALQKSVASADADKGATMAAVANAVLQVIAAGRPFATDPGAWDTLARRIDHVNRVQVALVARDYVSAVAGLEIVVHDFTDFTLPTGITKTLTFAATISSADTSEEMTAALEAAAVPVMSFRVKRTRTEGEQGTWVGINAYVGAGFGKEHTSTAGSPGHRVGFGGLTVPVGVELGSAVSAPGLKSVSVFFPLLDVGTVASFRTKAEDTEQNPSLTFSQVVAPGAFLTLGITQKYPLSIGFGAQFVPKLRRATGGGALFDVVRYGAFVAVDVPIFRFR